MQKRRQPEIIAGRVNADGSIAAGDGFSTQRTGVGTYVVTFVAGFRVFGGSACTARGGANTTADVGYGADGRSWTVITSTCTTGVAGDFPFTFNAVGVQQ